MAVWLTHARFDRVGAPAAVHRRFYVPVYLRPNDLGLFGLELEPPRLKPGPLEPGRKLTLGRHAATCLFEPGQVPGHMAFYLPK